MDNNTFRKWVSWKKGQAQNDLAGGELDEAGTKACKESLKWLESAEKMAKYADGSSLRRFKKDYERRLARLGPQFLANYEREGAALK